MDKIKNYAIAILTGLLALSLFTQPAQSAGKSKEAKQIEYQTCLNVLMANRVLGTSTIDTLNYWFKECAILRP